jgi:putative transposase
MEVHSAYRFEIDPSDRQRTNLRRSAGLSHKAWNWGLGERKADYETRVKPARERGETVRSITAFDQINAWNKAKVEIAPWACEHSSRIPEHALTALDKSYKAWWAALKSGRRAGPPRFKTRGKCKESFTTHGAIKVDPTGITLPRIGRLRIKGSTRRVQGKILTATVSRTADRWFLSLTVERDIDEPIVPNGGPVGIDMGLTQSLVLSTGEVIQGPRALKTSLVKLRRAQKAVARSQRNSGRRKVKVVKVARIHARVANVRGNWLHGVSDRLTREHAVIGHEDLNIRGLASRKSRQGRAWADLGAGELFRQIAYKAAWRGVTVVVADRFYPSSQLCSNCGFKHAALTLKDRQFICPSCGFTSDRDLNSAFNLRPVAVMPTETLNARGGGVSPDSNVWQIPMKREPRSGMVALAAA